MKPLTGKTVAARQTEWDARLKRYQPDDLPVLAEALLPFGRRSVEYRLPLLHAKGKDPRLAEVLTGWVEQRPAGYQGQPTTAFWQLVLKILGEIADARQRPRLEAVNAQVAASIGCHADTVLRDGLPAVLAKLGEAPPLPGPPPDASALFAAVYANPEADAPRAVLADLLLSSGDPRGELISLQLGAPSRASAKRCKELLAAHGKAWTGALAPAVRKEGLTFARGFVQTCHLGPTPAELDLAACLELATVEALHVATGLSLPAEMWTHLRSLKSLTGHGGAVFRAPVALPRLAELDVEGPFALERVLDCANLPALTQLRLASVHHGPDRVPLWAAPLGRQLKSVWFGHVLGDAPEWRAWMESAPSQVQDVSVGLLSVALRLTMRRVAAGWRAELILDTHGDSLGERQDAVDQTLEAAGTNLAAAGLERCAEITIAFRENTRGPGWPATHLPPSDAAVKRLLSRLPRATIV